MKLGQKCECDRGDASIVVHSQRKRQARLGSPKLEPAAFAAHLVLIPTATSTLSPFFHLQPTPFDRSIGVQKSSESWQVSWREQTR